MGKTILVVDIETTGYLKQGGKIVEIGIVKLDLETGTVTPVYNSLIKESGLDISHTTGPFGWIFKNSDLTFNALTDAPSLEDQRFLIQKLFNIYHATAYNKAFDFGFLKDRGFQINELPCPMLLATPIMNLEETFKWPKLEEAWDYFIGKAGYIEKHRALDDAIHEAKIVYQLYKMGQFVVSYNCVKAKFKNSYRESGYNIVFIYEVSGTTDELSAYKTAQGTNYKQNEDGVPLYYSDQSLSNNRNEIIPLIITEDGHILVDDFNKIESQKKKFDEYVQLEKIKSKECSIAQEGNIYKECVSENYDEYFSNDESDERLTIELSNGLNDAGNYLKKSLKFIPVFKNGLCGFCDENQNVLIPCIYDELNSFNFGLAAVKFNGKYGFIDYKGKEIIPYLYDTATSFVEGLSYVTSRSWCGFIDRHGKRKTQTECFDYITHFSEGLAVVQSGRYDSIIDRFGNKIIPFQNWHISIFKSGMALIFDHDEQQYKYIDRLGNEIITKKYDKAESFSEGMALVSINGKYGFIDTLGYEVLKLRYDFAGSFSEGLAPVCLDGKWGFINNSGKIILPLIYDFAERFSEGKAAVALEGRWGFIDVFGKIIIPLRYAYVDSFNKGLAIVRNNEWNYGFINTVGEEIIPLIYHEVKVITEDLIIVNIFNNKGIIDNFGNVVIHIKYSSIYPVIETGFIYVVKDGKHGLIDFFENEIVPLKYEEMKGSYGKNEIVNPLERNRAVKMNGKWGFIDYSGKEIISFKYDNADCFSKGYGGIELKGKWGKIDKFGKEYWE